MYSILKNIFRKYKDYRRNRLYHYSSDLSTNTACHYGRYTYGLPIVTNYNESQLYVGNFCSIAQGVTCLLGGEHFVSRVSQYNWDEAAKDFPVNNLAGGNSKGDIIIGNDVWIGRNVTILSGVTIGDGAVIGAGGVVSKDISPYAIAVGNPIRVIRYRFDEMEIKALLKIQWWNWDDEKIKSELPLIASDSVEKFIVKCLGDNWRNEI